MLEAAFLSPNGRTGTDITILVVAAAALPIASIISGRRIRLNPAASLTSRYAWIIARGWAISLLVLATWRMHDRPLASLGLDLPVGKVGCAGLVLVGLLAAAAAIVVVLGHRMATPRRIRRLREQVEEIGILPRTNTELSLFIGVAVTAGVWEELVYRGFLIWFLAPEAGIAGAIALSTILFAIGHLYQGWRGMLRAGGTGLAFAIWYVLSGSLWWLIGLHALIDLFGGLVAWRLLRHAPDSAQAMIET